MSTQFSSKAAAGDWCDDGTWADSGKGFCQISSDTGSVCMVVLLAIATAMCWAAVFGLDQ